MTVVSAQLLARLEDLALVEVDTLIAGLDEAAAAEMLGALVGDLEHALGEARDVIREAHGAFTGGADPLGLLDHGPEARSQGGETAIAEASARLAERAAARHEIARLEEIVRAVLPRLLQADRRLTATAAVR
jgi:hypothetical protein